jgi:hypothetical protein
MVDKSIQGTCPIGHGDYYGTACPGCDDEAPVSLFGFVEAVVEGGGTSFYGFAADTGHLVEYHRCACRGERVGLDRFEITLNGEALGEESMYQDLLDRDALGRMAALIDPKRDAVEILGTIT